jgi:RimJ/RimL family protein N-acetyltransferase
MKDTLSPASFGTKDGRAAIIREARPADAKPCIDIVREATTMRPRTIMTMTNEVWGVREWRRRMLNLGSHGVTLVAEIDGVVTGLLGAARGERPATKHGLEVGITVGEPFRGIGVGRALMESAESWARAHQIERMVLGVYDGNPIARSLYESLGYEVEGIERRNVKFPEGYRDTIRMAKFLT